MPKRAIQSSMSRPLRLRGPDPRAQAREQARARQRASIVSAARQVFSEMGYDGAHMRDIVRRANLPASVVQQQFADKEALLHTLVDATARVLRARVRAARDRATSLEEFVVLPYRAFFTFVAEDRVAFDLLRRDPAIIRGLLEEPSLGASVTELREDLEAARARGHLPGVDLDYLTAAMAGVAVEVAVRMVERQPADIEGATSFVSSLFLGGLDRLRETTRPDRTSARRPRTRPSR
jgi:AcrR family transcriptional regulator